MTRLAANSVSEIKGKQKKYQNFMKAISKY